LVEGGGVVVSARALY